MTIYHTGENSDLPGISQLKIAILRRALARNGVRVRTDQIALPLLNESLNDFWARVGIPALESPTQSTIRSADEPTESDQQSLAEEKQPTSRKQPAPTLEKTIQAVENSGISQTHKGSAAAKLGFVKRLFNRLRFWNHGD